MPGAPVVLIAAVNDGTGRMTASRAGEPKFTAVTDLSDAMMATLSRKVDLLVHAIFSLSF